MSKVAIFCLVATVMVILLACAIAPYYEVPYVVEGWVTHREVPCPTWSFYNSLLYDVSDVVLFVMLPDVFP